MPLPVEGAHSAPAALLVWLLRVTQNRRMLELEGPIKWFVSTYSFKGD